MEDLLLQYQKESLNHPYRNRQEKIEEEHRWWKRLCEKLNWNYPDEDSSFEARMYKNKFLVRLEYLNSEEYWEHNIR